MRVLAPCLLRQKGCIECKLAIQGMARCLLGPVIHSAKPSIILSTSHILYSQFDDNTTDQVFLKTSFQNTKTKFVFSKGKVWQLGNSWLHNIPEFWCHPEVSGCDENRCLCEIKWMGPETDHDQVGWQTHVTSISQSEASVVTCDQSEVVRDYQETITSFSIDTPGCSLMTDDYEWWLHTR